MPTIILMLTSFFIISIGLAILWIDKKKPLNIAFFLFCFFLGLWTFLFSLMYVVKTNTQGLILGRITPLPCIFLPSIFVFLARNFPEIKYKLSKKYIIWNLISICIILFFSFTKHWISSVIIIENTFLFEFGFIYTFFFIYILSLFFYGLGILFIKFFLAKKENKLRILYLILGIVGSLLVASFFVLVLPALGISQLNFFAPTGTLILVGFWSWAIVKHRMMDVLVVIGNGLAYLLTLIFVIISFLLTIYYLPKNIYLFTIATTSLGVVWALVAIPLKSVIITTTKRKFIKGYYDADLVFKNISKKLAKENDRSKMFRTVAQVFDKQMQFEKIVTLIALRDKDQIMQYLLLEEDFDTQKISLEKKYSLDDPVMQILTKQITPFYLKDTEKEMQKFFVDYGFPENTFCLPFASLDGLEGMIILGERSCGKVLKEPELELFNTIISHVSALLYKYTSVEKVRKQFEANQKQLYETEVQLVRAEKIASLVRTTQECQHEIRTPINAIKLWLDGLSEHPSTDEIEEFRKVAVKHINRLLYVVDSSLSLGSNKEKKLEKVNINEIIEEATDLIPSSGYSLVKKLETVPNILGVKAELISVFLNFINNAKKAMEKSGGTLTIKSFFDENSQNVIVKVIDTGVGIASENLERIWEPYFTTDKTYGHGLGLSIVHQIVQSYKGIVQVESVLKKGTTFTLKFPTAK
jgi:signal transduction histidine kinase